MAKEHFEQWIRELAATEISHLHIDYGIFSADLLVQDCNNKFQNQSFLRVCVQNQNTLAQLSIQTIMCMDQTFFGSCFLNWSEYIANNLALGGHLEIYCLASQLYSQPSLWSHTNGITTKTKANHHVLLYTHVWGFPVYNLNPKLQS